MGVLEINVDSVVIDVFDKSGEFINNLQMRLNRPDGKLKIEDEKSVRPWVINFLASLYGEQSFKEKLRKYNMSIEVKSIHPSKEFKVLVLSEDQENQK